jgi:argininosuccinate lyase
MVLLNRSLDVDFRLWRYDICASQAWARALASAEVITADEAGEIVLGLDRVAARLEEEGLRGAPDEDIHSLVERLLYEEAGSVAGKLHSGRSRNDQVATDLRLWGMDVCEEVERQIVGLAEALAALAGRSVDLVMPGYTHLQQAQPIRAAHWALSHLWPLLRDRDRIRRARRSAATLPLGSGAIAGCPFPVDREHLRGELGFDSVSENSLDGVSDRDWAAELVFAGALLGGHLSRLGEDLVLFASKEFGYVRLGDGYSTGSSLMPQKRNPDVGELTRGKAGRLTGNLMALLTLMKGLPTGYNRDLQEDKQAVFDTIDTLNVVLPAITGAVGSLEWQVDRLAESLDSQLLATDLADYLVRKGVPFRESHEAVGRLVREAEREGCTLEELSDEMFRTAHEHFEDDVRDVFSWERSVEARDVPGGTSRASVEAQLTAARSRLAD